MARNINYTFTRLPTSELPPRFDELLVKLESIGIYGAMLSHPDSDWNRITLTIGENRMSQKKLERIFTEIDYSPTTFPAPTSSDSRKK